MWIIYWNSFLIIFTVIYNLLHLLLIANESIILSVKEFINIITFPQWRSYDTSYFNWKPFYAVGTLHITIFNENKYKKSYHEKEKVCHFRFLCKIYSKSQEKIRFWLNSEILRLKVLHSAWHTFPTSSYWKIVNLQSPVKSSPKKISGRGRKSYETRCSSRPTLRSSWRFVFLLSAMRT